MAISRQKHNELCGLIENLFDHISFDLPDDRPVYAGYLRIDRPFCLDEDGYYVIYQNLKRSIFTIENLGENWSNQGLEQEIHQLILELATLKDNNTILNFEEIALGFEQKIDIEFQEYECIVSIIGLTLTSEFQIGDVTFLPFDANARFSNKISEIHIGKLLSHRDCFATTKIRAEWIRSTELAREKTEKALNILRFLGSLIWPSEPAKHIYVSGQQLERVSSVFVIDPEQKFGTVGHSEFSVQPFKIDNSFIQYAEIFGLSYLRSLINQRASPLEEDLFAAIQWYGFASQELLPLVSFVKFYIAIETATKKEKETAKKHLPKRISILLELWDELRQKELEIELGQLIDERNSVFHEGRAHKYSPSYLADSCRVLAREVIQQLCRKIASEKWKTKDDMIDWVEAKSIKS